MDNISKLLEINRLFITKDNMREVLEKILDTAIAIASADMGNIQLFDGKTSSLKIVVHRGFDIHSLDFWNHVQEGQGACGTALARGSRVIVEDVTESPIFRNTPALDVQLKAGVRAIISTLLIGRSGKVIGIMSTHFRKPHRPDDSTLRLLDLLARQATDIIEREQHEKALKDMERLETFRLFVESAPVAIAMFDRDMRYLAASHRWSEEYDLKGRDILGLSHYKVFPEISDRWKDAHQRGLSGEVVKTDEDLFERVDGGSQWLRWEITPWRLGDGQIGGIIIFTEDITQRKQAQMKAERDEQRLKLALKYAKAGMWEWNTKTNENRWSDGLWELYGLEPNSCQPSYESWAATIHPNDRAKTEKIVAEALAKATELNTEWRVNNPDGSKRWLMARGGPLLDDSGQPYSYLGIVIDVTKQKLATETVKKNE
ncbi:MAG: PAS domain S-box protein [Desulfomonilaceae bacterium]